LPCPISVPAPRPKRSMQRCPWLSYRYPPAAARPKDRAVPEIEALEQPMRACLPPWALALPRGYTNPTSRGYLLLRLNAPESDTLQHSESSVARRGARSAMHCENRPSPQIASRDGGQVLPGSADKLRSRHSQRPGSQLRVTGTIYGFCKS